MSLDTRQIAEVQFGLFNPQEILAMSQCEINTTKREGHGSVYDPRMGTLDRDKCETCGETAKVCPGHFGHIELHVPVIHPEYFKQVMDYLRCTCLYCYRFLTSKEEMELHGINRFSGQARIKKVLEKVIKADRCPHCGKGKAEICREDDAILQVHKEGKRSTSLPLTPEEIRRAFDNISDDDVCLLGVDPTAAHPRCLIFTRLPVMPPAARPPVRKDGDFADDDLTNQYIQIIQANNRMKSPEGVSEAKQRELIGIINYRIATTFRNASGNGRNVAKHPITNRAIRSISKRLSGKHGQLRDCLSGKRVEQSARSVISPDSELRMDEVGVPANIAKILTVPERVTKLNVSRLQKLMDAGRVTYDAEKQKVTDTGQIEFVLTPDKKTSYNMAQQRRGHKLSPGDVIFRGDEEIPVTTGRELAIEGDFVERLGKPIENLRYANQRYELKIGQWVERKLQDGDVVLINRQPTLHRGSMLAMRAKILPFKTIRMNLSITGSLNADFDLNADSKQ